MAVGEMLRAMVNVPGTLDEAIGARTGASIRRAGFRVMTGVLRRSQPVESGDTYRGCPECKQRVSPAE